MAKSQMDIKGGAHVEEALVVDGTAKVAGATTCQGALSVQGVATVANSAVVGGALSVAGASALAGDLSVTGHSTLTGDADVGGDLEVTGQATVTGDLAVAGAAAVTGDLTLSGAINVTGAATLGSVTVGSSLSAPGGHLIGASRATANILLAPNLTEMDTVHRYLVKSLPVLSVPPLGPFQWTNLNTFAIHDQTTPGQAGAPNGAANYFGLVPQGITTGVTLVNNGPPGSDPHILIEIPGTYLMSFTARASANVFTPTDVDVGVSFTYPATAPPMEPLLDGVASSGLLGAYVPQGLSGSFVAPVSMVPLRMDLWMKLARSAAGADFEIRLDQNSVISIAWICGPPLPPA